ncbi:MAG: STAS domain-containing protein [Fusobacteriota bacterium]
MKLDMTKEENGIKLVSIEGEIDVYTSLEIKKDLNQIIDEDGLKLVIDLDQVTYIDSSGLGVFVTILKKINKKGGNMKLINLQPSVEKIFEITRLKKFFEIYENKEEAIKSFN